MRKCPEARGTWRNITRYKVGAAFNYDVPVVVLYACLLLLLLIVPYCLLCVFLENSRWNTTCTD